MAAAALPSDVRLMNGVSTAIFALAGPALAAAGGMGLARAPWFPVRAIQLEGELQRNSVTTIRANTTPRLAGNFFSFNLVKAREAFEAVPWVRHAVVRRVWPDRVAVRSDCSSASCGWRGMEQPRPAEAVVHAGRCGQASHAPPGKRTWVAPGV